MLHVHLYAADIKCEGCARAVDRSLRKLAGVHCVSVDVVAKIVTVGFEPADVTASAIGARLEQAGFTSTLAAEAD